MKVLLILKIGRGKVTNFSEVTKYFPDKRYLKRKPGVCSQKPEQIPG